MDDLMLLAAHARIALAELESASGLSRAEIVALVEYGAFAPEDPAAEQWTFPASSLVLARTAARLRADFELAPDSLALVLAYVERVHELERLVRELECRLPR
jgi:chaperone modulatory protein CbpM